MPGPQYAAWKALGEALNATGRPIYFSICPHTPTPALGTAREFAGRGQLSYAPPSQWNAAQRHALANSVLVEYVNTYDEWYAPRRSSPCRWVNSSWRGHFSHDCHGGIITNIDAMLQMTKLNYSQPQSWNDGDMLQLCTFGKGRTLGNEGMTMAEYRAHFSVWAVLRQQKSDLRCAGPSSTSPWPAINSRTDRHFEIRSATRTVDRTTMLLPTSEEWILGRI
jgi:hypothetical protein